ncbi:MAG: CRISPR-associated protein Cas4 [Desulfurococcales archaeon]|nr:CRISPR-associated protein Cas4 [Desulfurococcales archaeon]
MDVKHIAYCEYIIYIKYRLGVQESPTEYMEYGSEVEKEKHIAHIKALYKPYRVLKQPLLESPSKKLLGKPDYVLELRDHRYMPVEVKWAEPNIVRGRVKAKWDHLMQLAFYSILLEDTLSKNSPVRQGVIYYLRPRGRLVKVQIDTLTKKTALKLAEKVRDIARGRSEPSKPKDTVRCSGCNYRKYCPYHMQTTRKSS